ncbi:AMP-binding protein [Vibrio splendidus]
MFTNMIQSIIDRFHQTPNATAIVSQKGTISFHTLGERIQAVCSALAERTPNFAVIYGHKELDTVASIIACTFSGIPFSVVDTANPAERVKQILSIHNSDLVILGSGSCSRDFLENTHDLLVPSLSSEPYRQHSWTPPPAQDTFYVLTTSGSSGAPKGVRISYDNYGHFHQWYGQLLKDNAAQGGHVNHACLSFDMGILDLFSTLAAGQAVFMLPHAFNALPRQNIKLLMQGGTTTPSNWFSTPSFLEMMCLDPLFSESSFPSLTLFFVGGEFVSPKLIQTLTERFPKATIRHAYGPTETTCVTHAHPITVTEPSALLSLGAPLGNNRIQIEDESGECLAPYQVGEVVIYGEQVGQGYVPPEHPRNIAFGQQANTRFYKTGDFGYVDDFGHLFLKGRVDGQIKWRGNRVELTEIETVAAQADIVTHSAVVPIFDNNTISELILFTQLERTTAENKTRFNQHLREHLPQYMVPSTVHFLDNVPMNLHGKIDRNQLKNDWERAQRH